MYFFNIWWYNICSMPSYVLIMLQILTRIILMRDLWMLNSSTRLYLTSIVLVQNPVIEELFKFFYILFREWSRREWKASGGDARHLQGPEVVLMTSQPHCSGPGTGRRQAQEPGAGVSQAQSLPLSAARQQKLVFVLFHFLLSCCCKFAFGNSTRF